MRHGFAIYTIATWLLLVSNVALALRVNNGQYYGTVVHLTNVPHFAIILTNTALWSVIMGGKLFTRIFFGDLTLLERQKGVERFFLCLTESVLAMAYLHFIGYAAMRLFVCSIFLRVFHALGRFRHETIEQSAQPMAKHTIRLTIMLLILFVIDLLAVYHFGYQVQKEGFSMSLTFLLDYSLMCISALGTLVKVCINACSRAGSGSAADKYHATRFYVNVIQSVTASLFHIAFFGILMMYTLPIHLIRDLVVNLSETASNCRHLLNYRRLTANIDRVLPDATAEQLEKNKECAICYEEMVEGTNCKALPCSHVFHRQCLLRWFEKQTACAYCGRDVKKLFQQGGNANRAAAGPAARPNAAAAAAARPVVVVAIPAAAVAAAVAAPQQQQQGAQAVVPPTVAVPPPLVDNADLDNLTDAELEKELQRLVAEFQAAADRNIVLPPVNAIVPPAAPNPAPVVVAPTVQPVRAEAAPASLSSSAAVATAIPPVAAASNPLLPTSAAVAAPSSSLTAVPPLLPSKDPVILAQQVEAYQRYVAEQQAALARLESALQRIQQQQQ